ncbi:transmembrane protein 180-like [Mastacembelus armatus]|uniref:Major facilitator superfamily domain containing 13a-like n=1 Tax=Mastacembelus armatus TaxID=205130 RepID=A0A3Q3NE30_9TELE|nr:transmembrane protein 180-like [Mastacembelus armatus]XP_033181226.1 transmembrane protein 180-like [Mastacembelus armatus]
MMAVAEAPASGVSFRKINERRNKFGLNPAALTYAMTTLGSAMINNIFGFYYVKLFLNKYKISEGAFHKSQVVYMVWNAVNDPLFGYLQDNSKVPCWSQRRLSILYGAPLYSLAFLLAWFPWRSYTPDDWLSGLHLTVALCAFDAMLTFVLLAQCALFAEISSQHQSRIRLIKYSQVASLIGSSSVLFCGVLSRNMEDFKAFQAFTVLIAVLSCGCMLYTGFYSESQWDNKGFESDALGSVDQTPHQSAFTFSTLRTLTCQILTNRDFQLFVSMNFFQVFMLAFFNNFTMIFAEQLIPPDVLPSLAKSIMYGAGFICPQLLVLSCQNLLHGLGYYRIILFTFYMEAVMAVIMFVLGRQHYYILASFLTINMVITQAATSLFGLPLADIIDTDLQKYKRSSPLSSMVFGTNALFTKPAQSLAPMIVVNILNQFGYEKLKNEEQDLNPSGIESLHSVMFYLVCLVPMCVAAVQILAWKPFSIRNSHTVDTKYIDN